MSTVLKKRVIGGKEIEQLLVAKSQEEILAIITGAPTLTQEAYEEVIRCETEFIKDYYDLDVIPTVEEYEGLVEELKRDPSCLFNNESHYDVVDIINEMRGEREVS